MIDKDYIIIASIFIVLTASLITVIYNPFSNKPQPTTTENLFSTMTSLYEERITTPEKTFKQTAYTVTVIANSTLTIPITVSVYSNSLVAEDGTYSIVINSTGITAGSTTLNSLPEADLFMINYAGISESCEMLDTTVYTGSQPFWPELFLSHHGFTTAVLTKLDACRNEYFVTAN